MIDLVDVHAHFLTDVYADAAVRAGHVHPEGMPGWPAWSPQSHLALMDELGIRTTVLSVSAPGTHFGDDAAARALTRHVNEFSADVVDRHDGRFARFASLPLPDVEGSLTELVHALDVVGAEGIAIMSNAGGVYPGDDRYTPLHAELDRRGATVFVHPVGPLNWADVSRGRPRPMLEFLFDSARAAADLVLSGVLERHPDINWIFSHSGGALPVLVERIELFREIIVPGNTEPPVVQQLGRLWYDLAGTPFPHAAPALVRAFGHERVLYGSDHCWTPVDGVRRQVASIDAAPQPEGTSWRALTTRNAEALRARSAGRPA